MYIEVYSFCNNYHCLFLQEGDTALNLLIKCSKLRPNGEMYKIVAKMLEWGADPTLKDLVGIYFLLKHVTIVTIQSLYSIVNVRTNLQVLSRVMYMLRLDVNALSKIAEAYK